MSALLYRVLGFTASNASYTGSATATIYKELSFTGLQAGTLGVPGAGTRVIREFKFTGTAVASDSAGNLYRVLRLTGVAESPTVLISKRLSMTGFVNIVIPGYNIKQFGYDIEVWPEYIYGGDQFTFGGVVYTRTNELHESPDNITYTKVAATTNKDHKIRYRIGHDKYYRLVVNYYDYTTTPPTIYPGGLTAYVDLGLLAAVPPAERYWAGVADKSVDLIYSAMDYDSTTSSVRGLLSDGIVFMPDGEAWWLGTGTEYTQMPEVGPVDDGNAYYYYILNMPADLTYASRPIALNYTVGEPAPGGMPRTQTVYSFMCEASPEAITKVSMERWVDPGNGSRIEYRDWDTGERKTFILREDTPQPATPEPYYNLPPGTFMLDWVQRIIILRPLDANIGTITPIACVHLCYGAESTVETMSLTADLHRRGQPYVVVKDAGEEFGLIPTNLYLELAQNEPVVIGREFQIITQLVDEIGAPIGTTTDRPTTIAIDVYSDGAWVNKATGTTNEYGVGIDAGTGNILSITITDNVANTSIRATATCGTTILQKTIYCKLSNV